MQARRVLFAHERAAIRMAVERVLSAAGFQCVTTGDDVDIESKLADGVWAFVVDVGLPGRPGFELVEVARTRGVEHVLLVASVYGRASYKRRPTSLYGADDYVEVHHLGDFLPAKLRARAGLSALSRADMLDEITEVLRAEGDVRFSSHTVARAAELIAADLLLYSGELLADDLRGDEAMAAIDRDLGAGRALLRALVGEEGMAGVGEADPVGDAVRRLVASLTPGHGAAPATEASK